MGNIKRMVPKHNKTAGFFRSKLFDGLDSFATLEQRITALPTRKERGDAFEVFVEAYLCTQGIRRAAEVWPLDKAPIRSPIIRTCRTTTVIPVGGLVIWAIYRLFRPWQ